VNDRQPAVDTPGNPLEYVEAVCSTFRQSWIQSRPARIEDLLASSEAASAAHVLRNLLHIEIEARRRMKQSPTSAEYIRRFPQFAQLVRDAFFESTMLSLAELQHDSSGVVDPSAAADSAADAGERTVSSAFPAANRLGDYRLLRELGRGGFGIVYAAQHLRRQEIVALKTLPLGAQRHGQDDAERLHKFRREFRSLADINHPNLVGMHTLDVDGNQWFFTMDLIDGVDFVSYVRPDGELDESRLRSVLPQLAGGIMALHARHIIHRDLKPSNVLVDARGKVVILDFGMVAELDEAGDHTQSLHSGRFVGTPLYAAPEQLFGQRSAASDWYALGVMLFQALTKNRPFQGSIAEILQQKQQQAAPRLAGQPGLPSDLVELTDRLLDRAPDQRPDVLEIAKVLGVASGETPTETFLEEGNPPKFGRDQSLIGRERQRAELQQAKRQFMATRQPLVVSITGRSGEGKTSLAEAFLTPVRQQREMLVLAGRCYDRESVPFKAIDCLIDALVAFLRGTPGDHVQAYIPDDMPMLAQLFPVLRRVEAINALPSSHIANLDGKQVRDRGFAALRQMLIRISQRLPIAIFVDDLQWGDADSAGVLYRLLAPPEAPAVLLLGTYRSDEVAESPFLQQWEVLNGTGEAAITQREIAVGPLSEPQCVAMVVARTGIDNESIRSQAVRLYRDTGGNPYFIEQLIECFDPEAGTFTPAPLQEVLARRLRKLPAEAKSLLQVIAVFGQAMPIDEAFAVLGQEKPSFATLTHMRSERLVRLLGGDEQRTVDTYHDKIRETVITELGDDARRAWHLRIGETIEQIFQVDFTLLQASIVSAFPTPQEAALTPQRVFDLAYHFHSADMGDRAFLYSLLAAEKSKQQYALEIATDHFVVSRRYETLAMKTMRYRTALGLGQTRILAGRFELAAQALLESAKLADNSMQSACVETGLAEIDYKSGILKDSISKYEHALRLLGVMVPRTSFGFGAALLWELSVMASRSLLPGGRRTPPTDQRTNPSQFVRTLYQTVFPYCFANSLRMLWCAFKGLNQADRIEDPASKAWLYQLSIGVSLAFGKRTVTDRRLAESLEIARRLNNTTLEAAAIRMLGFHQLGVGQFSQAVESLQAASRLFETKVPDYWQRVLSRTWIATALLRLGQLDRSATLAREMFDVSVRGGQDRAAVFALDAWTQSTAGNLPFDELRSCVQLHDDIYVSGIQLAVAEAIWHLRHARTREAVASAEDAVQRMRRSGAIHWWTTPALTMLARTLREHAATLSGVDEPAAGTYRRRALRAARWSARVNRWLSFENPSALRELSLAYAANGKLRIALNAARSSVNVAQSQDARYELAQSRMVVAELSEKLGISGADQLLRDATKELWPFKEVIERAVAETVRP